MQPQRRKRSRFGDAPPAAPGLTAGVPAAANAAAAAAVQAMVNQNMLGSGGGTDNGASSSQALKVKTELFVGNIPAGCEGVALTEFLNGAMNAVNLNIGDGNPITEARITAKFAFIVLRTPEETTNALCVIIKYLDTLRLAVTCALHFLHCQELDWHSVQ